MNRLSRRAFTLAALSAMSALTAGAEAAPRHGGAPTAEMRGMWLATVLNRDWPSRPGLAPAVQRAQLLQQFDTAVRHGLNAVFFQVRPCADALWPSPYEPWSEYLTGTQGKNPGWDPLGTAVQEAHARGLQLHAWFNPYRVAGHTDLSRLAASHPARKHPDWVVAYDGKLFYNPGLPEVRAFVENAILDAVARYPVDGVHFDDYFYPYPVAGQTFDDSAAYAAYGKGFANRAAWRRNNINLLVQESAARVRQTRPTARFGISPFGVWRNVATDAHGSATHALQSYDDLYADTRTWVKSGWLDYICPQLYWNIGFAPADYAELVRWWAQVAQGTRVRLYVGEALYKAGDRTQPAAWRNPAELSQHLTLAKRYPQVGGHVFFAAKDVATDRIGAMARVLADHYTHPAPAPL
ncbi:family 10 glycosylhydrolase [Streptomyces sp. NPDC047022]|uniref:glycoside hydrolase family 10 protein n=1 Tax=Streptomyces sp. NPDC047022 TaxID=3155737 RepID=UPI0033F6E2DA